MVTSPYFLQISNQIDLFLTPCIRITLLTLWFIGVADIMGRKYGSVKIPYNQKKSWAGSISMFVFGSLVSLGMLYYYTYLGYFNLNWMETVQKVAFVSLVATAVESLPITDVVDDNISVPLASMAAAYLSFSL